MSGRSESNVCETTSETVNASVTVGRMSGMVKWFNNKSGFGFITVVSDNSNKGSDIFVHYSAIRVSNSQYKFLIQGEYVDFDLISSNIGVHKFNASDVCGINEGPIMCETRRNAFEQSTSQAPQQPQDRQYTVRSTSQPVDDGFKQVRRGPKPAVDTRPPRSVDTRPPRSDVPRSDVPRTPRASSKK